MEARSTTPALNVADSPPPMAGVSQKNWDKFLSLQQRRLATSQRSREKRINEIKNSIVSKVKTDFTREDELQELKKHHVDLETINTPCPENNGKKNSIKSDRNNSILSGQASCGKIQNSPGSQSSDSGWQDIKEYLHVNDHLTTSTGSGRPAASHLEERIDEAVANNDIDTAERLSDQLAVRAFGTQISKAIDAKKFSEKRKQEEEVKAANKKKKLAWGFEHKQRWETKGNM